MKKVRQVLSYIVMVVAIIVLIIFYNKYNFNNFDKNIRNRNATEFVRDNKVKCSKMTSYSMNNKEYNDGNHDESIYTIYLYTSHYIENIK